MAKVVFFGTPEYALPTLRALLACHQVLAVVTQPDRYAGRGRHSLVAPPVKELAAAQGVPVWQPERLRRDRATLVALRELGADVFVLAAYGQILRPEVLAMAPHGVVGLHASLLPNYRGAAPIAWAIWRGEAETGVTLMLTDAGMDTGPIIAQQALPIAPDDTTETLTARLAELAAEFLIATLPAWLAGLITPRPQDDALATLAPPITREQGRIVWAESAVAIDRQMRACTPWPGTYATYQGAPLKIISAHPADAPAPSASVGTLVGVGRDVAVVTGDGLLVLGTVQPAGKRPMAAADWARGQRALPGGRLE